MNAGAAVFNLDAFESLACALAVLLEEERAFCGRELEKAERYLEDVQKEETASRYLLDAARVVEAEKLAVMLKVDAELAAAVARETAALGSGNLIAAAEAGFQIARLTPEAARTTEEYNEAVRRRERMEHRYEMAVKCVELAQFRLDEMRLRYGSSLTSSVEICEEGIRRLRDALSFLRQYLDTMQPQARALAEKWHHWKPKEKAPVMPSEIHDRLNVSDTVTDSILAYLYATDPGVHNSVDQMRQELLHGADKRDVELKARKNLVGRLCEEIVIRTFLPMGEKVCTQERHTLEDGSSTRIDMTLYGLKNPLILGRGENMGAREGGSLAIEVKSGGKQYLLTQLEHLVKQAQGHQTHTLSCVVCTRDIKDLSTEQEERLRTALRDAGSPIYGMLPRKEALDSRCISFVMEGLNAQRDGGVS